MTKPSASQPTEGLPEGTEPTTSPAEGTTVTVTHPTPGTARVVITGELTADARRPLIREVTDLLLGADPPSRLQLDLHAVDFLNSAGLSTVVQVHRMLEGRGAELTLVVGTTAVARPLQLSGLWHRFHVLDERRGG